MVRRLGKRWQQLHRLIYLTAIGGVVHYLWLVKADTRKPLIYGAIVAALLGYRLLATWRLGEFVARRFSFSPAVKEE